MASPVSGETNEKPDPRLLGPDQATFSPSNTREAASRLVDDLEVLRAERLVSNQEHESRRSRSRDRGHEPEPEDAFNNTTSAAQEPSASRSRNPTLSNRLWVKIKKFPRLIRYLVYMVPIGIILLTPILLDIYALRNSSAPVGGPGGVKLLWFGIWLETVWLSLWAARIFTSTMPPLFGFVAKTVGSSNHKTWKDIGRQLEFHTTLFLWMLAVFVSFLPIVNNHRDTDSGDWSQGMPYITWIDVVDKIVISCFVLAALNFAEKILIQWIATSFHLRTYAYRIVANKREIRYLVQLYEHAKSKVPGEDPIWGSAAECLGPGAKTPMRAVQANARRAWNKIGDVANRVTGDLTGRKYTKGNHPRKVVIELLRSTSSSHTLARVFYRTFVRPDRDSITLEDILPAFSSQEEAEGCFGVFDKDLNGDISMDELELVCNEIHLEKKAIAASLKDLDSVLKQLDHLFMFIIFIIAGLVFGSIISGSAYTALGSVGTSLLGLSWLLAATAQEFLQSIIFVFVKHPFDVGDRVTIYGNTGSMMKGDDYYVQEVSLLYTEFKKMEGHIVQAPNSLLNTLFILNQRRSGALADPIELRLRYGTSEAVIEELKERMLDFVMQNKRDYAPRIITEVSSIDEVRCITVNFVFFHKSNFQNELLRLTRHNKFASELMRQMCELGIEGPGKMVPGGRKDYPIYWANIQPPAYEPPLHQPRGVSPNPPSSPVLTRRRAESRAPIINGPPDFQDVYENRKADSTITRLHSIRSGEVPNLERIGSPVERMTSGGAGAERRHLFSRPRAGSKSTAQGGPGNMV